jgi:hypothetical protein
MRPLNTGGCPAATRRRPSTPALSTVIGRALRALLAAALALALAAAPARAQPGTPAPDASLAAHAQAERWVRAWAVPDAPPDDAPRAAGACVLLRAAGRTLARGVAWTDAAGSSPPSPLPAAARAALAEAASSIRLPNDATRDGALRLVAADLLVSVELAGPLSVYEPATWADAEADLRPGLDGVAVRLVPPAGPDGRQPEPGPLLAAFPSQTMLSGTLPHRALAGLCAQTIGEGGAAEALDEPAKLRDRHALRMYRFRVQHAAQPAPGRPAALLYRGQRLIPPSTVPTAAELRLYADDLANSLLARRLTRPGGPETVAGVLRAGAEPTPTGPTQRLLAAFALATYRDWLRSQGTLTPGRERELGEFIRPITLDGLDADSVPAGPALRLLADRTGARPEVGRPSAMLSRSYACLRSSVYGVETFDPPVPPEQLRLRALVNVADLPLELRPVILLAALRHVPPPHPGDEQALAHSDALLRAVYADAGVGRLVSLMPWLGWAELAQADRVADVRKPGDHAGSELRGAVALRHMRDQLWQHQLTIAQAGEDALDMAGGIVFTAGLREGRANPYPTWQCARPLAFVATMLRDPRLTEPQERPREIARLMQALRFLRQLQADDASMWMASSPAELGAVRAATWDPSMPIDATSMTLLCVVETLRSLDALAKESGK